MQVAAVNMETSTYIKAVKPTALSVPRGMLLEGSFSSPDRFAPAMIPVTPLNRTPNTVANVTTAPSGIV